jgi:flagellar biosynthesis/type III secretory pathway M-ring protein FliF/YscJ
MNESLQALIAQLKSAGSGGKAVAALVGVAVLAIVGSVAVVTSGPHFEMAFSNLSDHESAAVMKSLSEAGIEFRVSQPPGPFMVYVDEDNVSSALGAAYGSGALDRPLRGVRTEATGMSSVFLGAKEREQRVRFRELEELEGVLEDLHFVATARVLTSREEFGKLGGRGAPMRSASVMIGVYDGTTPTEDQATAVAQLVSRALGISLEDISVSDQKGVVVYDGDSRKKSDDSPEDWLVFKQRYDTTVAQKANDVLTQILGPNKSQVMVDSTWDFTRTVVESRTPVKGERIREDVKETSTPIEDDRPDGAGAGPTPNDPDAPAEEPLVATTEDKTTEYTAGMTSTSTVNAAPLLTRLSVALFLDESIPEEQRTALEATVKTTVGWFPAADESGEESFSTTVLPFYAPEEVPVDETTDVPTRPNPLVNTLMRRGVEVGTALVFLFLLLRTLRGAKKAAAEGNLTARGSGAPGAINVEDLDPELLAREQVQDLLSSDPERVGKILSSWAREEQQLTGSGR